MAVFSMSCRPWGTNEPCVTCSSKESYAIQATKTNKTCGDCDYNILLNIWTVHHIVQLTILSAISCADSDVILPEALVRATFHLTCLLIGDGGSSTLAGFSLNNASSFTLFLFSSNNFFSSKSYPPRESRWGQSLCFWIVCARFLKPCNYTNDKLQYHISALVSPLTYVYTV